MQKIKKKSVNRPQQTSGAILSIAPSCTANTLPTTRKRKIAAKSPL